MRNNSVIILLGAITLIGCGDVTCDADSVEVASARLLSHARLEKIANDVDELLRNNSKPSGSLWTKSGADVPERFKDIGVVVFRVTPLDVRLRLKGCMDHHVDLVVTSSTSNSDRIELWYGEGPTSGKEVLWEAETVSAITTHHEASMNFDMHDVKPFLEQLNANLNLGLDINKLLTFTDSLSLGDEERIEITVRFKGQSLGMIYQVYIDDIAAPDLYLFAETEALAFALQSEMVSFAEARGM